MQKNITIVTDKLWLIMIIMAQSSKLFTSQPGQVLAKLPARTMENNTTLAYKYWTAYVIAYE